MSLLSSVASLVDVFGYMPEDSIKNTMDPTKLNMIDILGELMVCSLYLCMVSSYRNF